MSQEISINISPCPNDVYIFGALVLGKVEVPGFNLRFDFLDIEQLNQKANKQQADVIKVSAANWLRLKSFYNLLPCGGALGEGCGPLLLGNIPENEKAKIFPSSIMVPGEFTTANFLLNFYLNKNAVHKNFQRYDVLYKTLMEKRGSYGVVIHESRFTYEQDGLTLVKDLGQYWEENTGLPIPLGIIVLKDIPGLFQPLQKAIVESIDWAEKNTQEILDLCRLYSQNMEDSVMLSHIRLYVNHYSRDMGEKGQEALDKLHSIQLG